MSGMGGVMSAIRVLCAFLMVCASGLSGVRPVQAQADRGWWVVLGAVSAPDNSVSPQAEAAVRRIMTDARRCGLAPFQDFSSKFSLFSPGYMVVVTGAYASRAAADVVASKAVRCIDGAYVKHSIYAGE
jgi:hypothetical protein